MADNAKIARDVLAAVGGKDNITQATHCMTRLRLNLKDANVPKDEEVKKIQGVLGVVRAGGQYQVIIGSNVPKVYTEVCSLTGLAEQKAIPENLDAPKEKLTLKKIGGNIMNYLAGSMTPLIPILMVSGLCKALTALFGPDLLNWLSTESPTYILLDFMYDAGFYYIPILIGYNAAKKLNVPGVLGAYMGCILLAPDFMEMVTNKTPFTIFGLPVTMVNYSQSVIPIIFSVAFMALVYKLVAKVMPDTLSTIFTPFLAIMIATPVSFLALAPVGTFASNLITGGLASFSMHTGFLGVAVIAAIWQFLVMTGMHIPVITAFMVDYLEKGYLTGAILGGACSVWACWGVALGAFLRLKNKEEKATAGGFFISGVVGGITEPCLYGLCFEHRRCFLGLVLGGFAGGGYLGFTHVCKYVSTPSNFLNLLGYVGRTTANMVNGILSLVISLTVAAIVTYFFGFTKEELKA